MGKSWAPVCHMLAVMAFSEARDDRELKRGNTLFMTC